MRKGISTLTGLAGGAVNVPTPNPPVPPPPEPPVTQQTVPIPVIAVTPSVFAPTVTRSSGLQNVVLPLVTSTNIPLAPTVSFPAGAVNLLTLFNSRYPASGAEIWVDPAGNDANVGSSGSPKRTIAGAIAIASAGSQIRARAGTYNDGPFSWSGKNGTQTNWIHLRFEPGAILQVAGGGGGQGLSQLQNCSYIAIYGGEWIGVNNVANQYEIAHLAQFGAHSWAVWGGTYHDNGGHAVAALNSPGRFDVCYNRMHHLANWNESQASAISCLGITDVGTAWPDGYMNHVVGNVIDATWTDPSRQPTSYFVDPAFVPTDGNAIILDRSGGFNGRTLIAHNLVVGCGGKGIHALEVHHVDAWLNTSVDNSQNLAGSWIGELSIFEATDCRFAWNVAAARPGNEFFGTFYLPGTSTFSDTVVLRGAGGSGPTGPSVTEFNNVDKRAVGPSGYFVAYQPGVYQQISITNVAGFRPKLAQVMTFSPPTNVRNAVSPWPDALGVLRPTSGNWAYGAFEGA